MSNKLVKQEKSESNISIEDVIDSKKENTVLLVIIALDMLINLASMVGSNNSGFITGVLISITDAITLISCILVIDKPIIAIIGLNIAQMIELITDLILGYSISGAVGNLGAIWIVSLVVLILNVWVLKKKKKLSIKEIVVYKRKLLPAVWWVRVTIWSMLVTILMSTANSNMMKDIGNSTEIRLYGAMTVVLPTFFLLGILSTSELVLDFTVLYRLIEIFTIYNIYKLGELSFVTVAYMILEIAVTVIMIYKHYYIRRKFKVEKK